MFIFFSASFRIFLTLNPVRPAASGPQTSDLRLPPSDLRLLPSNFPPPHQFYNYGNSRHISSPYKVIIMKNLALTLLTGIAIFAASCSDKSAPDKIEVIGMAENELTPDIVYVGISLREYFQPGTSTRVPIETLEGQLQASLKAAKIDLKNLLINNVSSYQDYYNKRRNPQFLAGKQYRLKLPDVKKLDAVLKGVDPQGIQNTQIEGYDYSDLDVLRKNLTIKALQAAKAKAAYLAESLDKELGDVMEISELSDTPGADRYASTGNAMGVEMNQSSMPSVDFKTFKFSYKIRAVFRMK